MNALIRRHWKPLVPALTVMLCLVAGRLPLAGGQTLPSNPLRTATRPAVVQTAPEVSPSPAGLVRPAVHAEPVAARRAAARPAANQTASYPYGSRVARVEPRGFVPRHERVAPTQASEEIIETPMLEDSSADGEWGDVEMSLGGDCDDCGSSADCNDCCGSVAAACGGCGACTGCLIPCPIVAFDNIELFAGTQSFSGPLNRGETGSFGFHYGVNWGLPVPCMPNQPFGFQIGYRGVSANYSGASFSEDSRSQTFLTGGLFRRVDWGLQGGVVVDVLSDEWYYDDLSLTQLRGELSWVFPACHELGVLFTAGSKTSEVASSRLVNGQRVTLIEEYEATDLLAGFYRRRFEALGNGYGRAFAGFTGNSGGLVGADFSLPLTENWELRTGFAYLIPQDGNNRVAYREEAWNVALTMVWYPGQRKAVGNDYFRPLFDVADNGIFIPRPVAP
ncbi:MAG: hypothetical protein MUF48_10375 [Pirellulaceae bacterium]|nr:hypothetical protein [Pirellulaceae bacterium]